MNEPDQAIIVRCKTPLAQREPSTHAQLKWEKDESAPTATVLAAFAHAGADALYIVTGRRTVERSDETVQADEHIAAIRRDMLISAWEPVDGEVEADAQERVMSMRARQLQSMMQGRAGRLTDEQQDEVETLLNIITSPVSLAAFRAADRVQHHSRRRRLTAALL